MNRYGRSAVIKIDRFAKEYEKVLVGEIKPLQLMKELRMSKVTFYRL